MLKKQFQSTKSTCKVTFTLPKEAVNGGKSVKLIGDFNNWNPKKGIPMKASKGEFKTVVELQAGREYQFRYLIDNATWANDWAADSYQATPYGVENSVVMIPSKKATAKKTTAKKAKTATKKRTTTKVKAKATATKATAKRTATKAKATKATTKRTATKAKAKKAVTKKTTAKRVTRKVTPKKTSTRKSTLRTADDLTKIEGIGPKIAQLLNKDGVLTFANLGKCSVTRLKKVLTEAGSRYKMHDPSTWSQQAKLAAKGEWTKLTKLQDKLNGGKKK